MELSPAKIAPLAVVLFVKFVMGTMISVPCMIGIALCVVMAVCQLLATIVSSVAQCQLTQRALDNWRARANLTENLHPPPIASNASPLGFLFRRKVVMKEIVLDNPVQDEIRVQTWNDYVSMILHQNGKSIVMSMSQLEKLVNASCIIKRKNWWSKILDKLENIRIISSIR